MAKGNVGAGAHSEVEERLRCAPLMHSLRLKASKLHNCEARWKTRGNTKVITTVVINANEREMTLQMIQHYIVHEWF